jgi:FlaG/FlaF family flagellin (archaellin)
MHAPTERGPLYLAVLVMIGIVVAAAGFLASLAFPRVHMSVI